MDQIFKYNKIILKIDDSEKRAPGWGKRAPGWGKRAPGWGKRAPGWGKRALGWGKRAPGWGKRNTEKEMQSAFVECILNEDCLKNILKLEAEVSTTNAF